MLINLDNYYYNSLQASSLRAAIKDTGKIMEHFHLKMYRLISNISEKYLSNDDKLIFRLMSDTLGKQKYWKLFEIHDDLLQTHISCIFLFFS